MTARKQPSLSEIIVWGAGSHARVLWELLEGTSAKLVALVDDNREVTSPIDNVPLLHGTSGLEDWLAGRRHGATKLGGLVAVGDNARRIELQERLEALGVQPFTAIHPIAWVANGVPIGAGTQIMANVSVGVDSEIGRGCIVFSACCIEHHCRLGDGAYLSPHCSLAGHVTVADLAFIGTGAVILPRVAIGEGAIVGAGAVVLDDVEPYTVVVGNPSRVIRRLKRMPRSEPAIWVNGDKGRDE